MQLTPEQALMMRGVLLGGIRGEYETTKKVLAAMPADQLDFKLGDKGRTMRQLAHHIVESEIWFAEWLQTGAMGQEVQTPADLTKEAILARFDKDVPTAIGKVEAMTGDQLAREMEFFGAFNYSAVIYLTFWSAHTIHHRGQLSTYLRALNAHVPSIYGGSADEPFEVTATA